jgi:hypothetical protein
MGYILGNATYGVAGAREVREEMEGLEELEGKEETEEVVAEAEEEAVVETEGKVEMKAVGPPMSPSRCPKRILV